MTGSLLQLLSLRSPPAGVDEGSLDFEELLSRISWTSTSCGQYLIVNENGNVNDHDHDNDQVVPARSGFRNPAIPT